MKLSLHIAKKLLALKTLESIPASSLSADSLASLLMDGILKKQPLGRTKYRLLLSDRSLLDNYLKNNYGINNLENYINALENKDLQGAEAISVASDSKIKKIRVFKGFLVNSYAAIHCTLSNQPFVCNPAEGSFSFIYDYENFGVPADVTIIGVENAENFRLIAKQKQFFEGIKPLFVSRYPQSGDLIKWLMSIGNKYIHYGDFDFAGLSIYLHEYKVHLKEKASFFFSDNIQTLIREYGNRDLYNKQLHLKNSVIAFGDDQLSNLIKAIDNEKKGLEQQVLIYRNANGD